MEDMSSLWGQLPDDPYANPPGPMVAWPGMAISGAIDEVKIQNGQGEDIAVGVYDPMLPDPGP